MASPADPFDRRNLLTYTSLLCGVGAVAAASAGRPSAAGIAVAAAVVADTFDGRFARRFGSDPRRRALGQELDSRYRPCSLAGQVPRLRDICA